MSCRRHGPACRTPWGWDPAHTDSPRPYTVEELAVREEGPHYYAYPSTQAYLEGWQMWRALRRETKLTRSEQVALGRGLWAFADSVEELVQRLLEQQNGTS